MGCGWRLFFARSLLVLESSSHTCRLRYVRVGTVWVGMADTVSQVQIRP